MKVELISSTSNPENVVAAAAKLCYSDKDAITLLQNLTPENVEKFIGKLSSMGHQSPFEHVSYTFSISGVSRALLAQITRHRIASYSVRSQRYVNENEFGYIIPKHIAQNLEARKRYQNLMEEIRSAYIDIANILYYEYFTDDMTEKEKQDLMTFVRENARYVLPNATETKMVVTMNARSLMNFFELRCCERSQDEIKELAYKMLKLCYESAPNIFKYAGPSCYHGKCNEGGMSCGKSDEAKSKGDCVRGIGC